jgi:hypothetical protein
MEELNKDIEKIESNVNLYDSIYTSEISKSISNLFKDLNNPDIGFIQRRKILKGFKVFADKGDIKAMWIYGYALIKSLIKGSSRIEGELLLVEAMNKGSMEAAYILDQNIMYTSTAVNFQYIQNLLIQNDYPYFKWDFHYFSNWNYKVLLEMTNIVFNTQEYMFAELCLSHYYRIVNPTKEINYNINLLECIYKNKYSSDLMILTNLKFGYEK